MSIEERDVAGLAGPGDKLTAIVFADGSERACGGLLVPVTLHQRSSVAQNLGAAVAAPGPVVADALEVDAKHCTTVPGLFAAGDAITQMPSVATAVAAGSTAAAMIVQSLMAPAHDPLAAGAGSPAAG